MSNVVEIIDVDQASFGDAVIKKSRQLPVLVDFWADWCGPCKSLAPILEKLAQELKGKLLVAKVNTDEQQELALQFGVRSLPTVVLFKQGEMVDSFMGALPERQVREFLSAHVGNEVDSLIQAAREKMAENDWSAAQDLLQQASADNATYLPTILAQVSLSMARMDYATARSLIDRVKPGDRDDAEYGQLVARLDFADIVEHAPSRDGLESAVRNNPKELRLQEQLAVRYFLDGDEELAMEQMLEIVRSSSGNVREQGRNNLVRMFTALGSADERVSDYRRKLARVLN